MASTELGRVRGLGSAKAGTEHFIQQRVTAIALVFTGLYVLAWFRPDLMPTNPVRVPWRCEHWALRVFSQASWWLRRRARPSASSRPISSL